MLSNATNQPKSIVDFWLHVPSGTHWSIIQHLKAKSRKYQGVFNAKSRVETWQVRGIWSQKLEHKQVPKRGTEPGVRTSYPRAISPSQTRICRCRSWSNEYLGIIDKQLKFFQDTIDEHKANFDEDNVNDFIGKSPTTKRLNLG